MLEAIADDVLQLIALLGLKCGESAALGEERTIKGDCCYTVGAGVAWEEVGGHVSSGHLGQLDWKWGSFEVEVKQKRAWQKAGNGHVQWPFEVLAARGFLSLQRVRSML